MKRWVLVSLVASVSFSLAGCPKLIREKKLKKSDLVPIYTFDDSYDQKKPAAKLSIFEKNFLYWKSAHKELVGDLDALPKRREAYYTYALDYLDRMKNSLPASKQSLVDVYEQRYRELKPMILDDHLNDGRKPMLVSKLKFLKNDIVKELSPHKDSVRNWFDL